MLMSEGNGRDQWARTAIIATLIFNSNRDPKKGRAMKPSDFNPYDYGKKPSGIEITKENIGDLRDMFGGMRKKKASK